MIDEDHVTWLGACAGGVAEAAIPPEEFLRRLREDAPAVASQGGPWLSFDPFRSEIKGNAFTIRNVAGKGENPRLEGVIEATAHGCLIRYAVRPPAYLMALLVGASAFALAIPAVLSLFLGTPALLFYLLVVPAMGLNWLLVPLFQRMSARRTLAFLHGLLGHDRLLDPTPVRMPG